MGDEKSNSNIHLELNDAICILIITICSICVRVRSIHHPGITVFDETYFGNFTNYYLNHTFYQDIHPPFAKLLMYKVAETGEYPGHLIFHGDHPFPTPEYVMLRLTPAILSSFVSPLIYLCVRFLGFSKSSAFSAGMLAAFETTLICEGRHILTDGILHFFSILHVTILFYLSTLKDRNYNFHIWHIITGISLGMACAIKNTAWGLMVLDACVYLRLLWPEIYISFENYYNKVLFYGITLFFINFVVFWGTYILHFLALPFEGPGTPYIAYDLRKHFVQYGNSSLLRPRLDPPNLLLRTIKYIYRTHEGNMKLGAFHESQSYPYNWPLLTGIGVFFYSKDSREIRCLGNAISYYLGFIGVIMCGFAYKRPQKWAAITVVVGYSASFFPFFLIPRVLYLYHYCIPLMLALVSYGACLDIYFKPREKGIIIVVSIVMCIYFYWLISPYIYALPMRDTKVAIWNKAWIEGDERHKRERSEDRKSK